MHRAGASSAIGIRFKLILMTGSVILITSLVFGFVSYERQREALLDGIDARLLAAAHLAASVPPDGYFDRIEDATSVPAVEYERIVGANNALCEKLGLQYLWSCMPAGGEIVFTTATSPQHDVAGGDHAKFFDAHSDPAAFKAVFSPASVESGQPDFSSFSNKWGEGRMVLVPARNALGRPYCFGASMSTGEVHALLAGALWRSVFITLVILAGGIAAAGALAATFARPLVRLTAVAAAIARGDVSDDEPTAAPGGGLDATREVESLAASIDTMRQAIRERIRALRESEESLSTTLDSIADAVIATDAAGRVIRMNPVAERMTGWPRAEAAGRFAREVVQLIDPGTRKPLADPVQAVLARGAAVNLQSNAVLVSRGGREHRVADSGAPIMSAGGQATGAVLVFRDVTEHLAIEEQLRHSQKMEALGHLAGGVAHDFNNILAGILGSAELLGLELGNPDAAREYLNLILTATERAGDLVGKLLDFARRGKVESTPVDVHESIETAAAILRRTVDKRITVRTKFGAAASSVIGDPAQLESALLNLGLNARDAMPEGGEITLRTENVELDENDCGKSSFQLRPGKHVHIEVRDTGMGIDPAVIERIFDPFFTTKEVGKGTGLGLAAVYGVVKDHRGAIAVNSRRSQGTVFHIYLPAADTVAPRPGPADDGEPPARGFGCILVVDDEEIVRATLRGMLEHLGYEVLAAEDGKEGVEVFRRHRDRIRLVILDAVMPRMRGRDCLNALKART